MEHFAWGNQRNGDDEWIPNVLLENSISWNLVCTTYTGGIRDIYDDTNCIILTWEVEEDIEIFKEKFFNTDLQSLIAKAHKKIQSEYAYVKSIWVLENNL